MPPIIRDREDSSTTVPAQSHALWRGHCTPSPSVHDGLHVALHVVFETAAVGWLQTKLDPRGVFHAISGFRVSDRVGDAKRHSSGQLNLVYCGFIDLRRCREIQNERHSRVWKCFSECGRCGTKAERPTVNANVGVGVVRGTAPPLCMPRNWYGQGHYQSYRPMTTDSHPECLVGMAAVPVTVPSVTHFTDAVQPSNASASSRL